MLKINSQYSNPVILIPARYDSSRFPGKPLTLLNNIPMVRMVYIKCISSGFNTYVVTDSRTVSHCIPYEHVVFTDNAFNGTERCKKALANEKLMQYDTIINVQGDMPDITPDIIHSVYNCLKQGWDIATADTEMPEHLISDPNSVKLIHNTSFATWFGRGTNYGSHHLGVYGYTRDILKHYPKEESKHEKIEKLEQLRWLDSGTTIGVTRVDFQGIEINTPEDVDRWHANQSS